jgi:signal transduction histidine kinase/CheY-like chemotaxis protein
VVAEDNPDHQRVIAEVIRRQGHEVVVAADGTLALDAVRTHRPALLIADVDMPRMSGLELCAAVRDDPAIAATPVVLITAYLLPADPRLAATGAIGVIGKPFSVPALSEALRGHLAAITVPPAPDADAMLRAVLNVLATDPDGPDAGDRILAAIGREMGWPYLRLWLVDEVTDRLRPAAVYVEPGEPPIPLPTSIARGHGLAGRCWETGELVWVPDLHAPDAPALPQVKDRPDYRSGGAVPVCSGEHMVGAITYFARTPQQPDEALGRLLTGIAAVVGAFLEHRRAEVLALHLAAATDEYMALAGHELRTPLTSIGSYIDLIAELPDDTPLGEVRDLFEVVHRNSNRLRDLIDNLLDVAGLESGHIPLATGPVPLADVVDDAVRAARPGRGIKIDVTRLDEVSVPGDRERLGQVVMALLSNAIKFSPPDASVTVSLVGEGTSEGSLAVLTVSDTGVGIPAAEQAKLFRRLYRGGNARHTGIPGSGLGLALCRVVVERHHGTISLASLESTGTTVTVRLPT